MAATGRPNRHLGATIKKLSLYVLGALLFLAAPAKADDYAIGAVGPFGGLNNTDSPLVIPANKAQDLLNVDITPGGKSVKKRSGYGLAATLTISTSPVHGVYTFFDSNGSAIDLYFNDRYMTSSVNGGSATVLFSTGTFGATYQCVDSQGYAYCNNTARTTLTKTDGATYSSIKTVNSTGTLVAVTQERLVTAGFSEAPNRIDFSKGSDFSTWTVGPQPTDPVQFTIVSPGSRITHIVYAFGRIIWFKDSSFGYVLEGDTQDDWQIRVISPNIGTLDNSSIYWQGILYFRGQDGHIYGYDGSNYQKMTRDIQGTISTSQSRRSNFWTQTTQADWQSGACSPTDFCDTTTNSGSIGNKHFSNTQTSTTDWAAGTLDDPFGYSDTVTNPGAIQSLYPDLFDSYRDGTNGTKAVWTTHRTGASDATISAASSILTITKSGTSGAGIRSVSAFPITVTGSTLTFQLADVAGTMRIFLSSAIASNGSIPNTANLVDMRFAGTHNVVQFESLKINGVTKESTFCSAPVSTASLFLSTFTFSLIAPCFQTDGTHTFTSTSAYVYIEGEDGSSGAVGISQFGFSPTTFTFTSSAIDTSLTSPVWGTFTANGNTTGISFSSLVSSTNVTYDSAVSASNGSALVSANKRYVKIRAFFNGQTDINSTSITDLTVTAFSTGSFMSAVQNAPNLSTWDTFQATRQDNGGNHTFYMRSSTNSFSVTSATPSWTSITAGAVPTISTGTYFQIRDDFSATSATATPKLDDFTVSWFEGSNSDKAYATYFNDALWWSITAGAGVTTNNRILRYDFLNSDWNLYDIPTNGMFVRNNSLYFGSSTEGKIFKFGDTDSDNGSAINAYWTSKDFFGDSPFVDKEIVNLSVAGASVQNSSITVTYTLNGETDNSYTVNLYDPNKSVIRSNKNLPQGKIGNTFRIKFGNDAADQPFEVYAIQYGVREKPWVPSR